MLACVERELKGWMKAMVKLSGTCFVTFSSSMAAVVFVGKLCSQNHFEHSACATNTITDATLFPFLCGFLDTRNWKAASRMLYCSFCNETKVHGLEKALFGLHSILPKQHHQPCQFLWDTLLGDKRTLFSRTPYQIAPIGKLLRAK